MLAYVTAPLLLILRVIFGPDGPQSSTFGILYVIAVSAPTTWYLCRDLYSEVQMEELRKTYRTIAGLDRAKEATWGILFLLGGLASLTGAAYVATR